MEPVMKSVFEPHRVAKIMAEILSKQRGYEVIITLTPKEAPAATEEGGG